VKKGSGVAAAFFLCPTANAVPTAEGAVQIAMEELPITLHRARVLVLGFGRLGKLAAHRFAALGAKVSVAARKWADLAWAEAYGYGAERIDQLGGWLCAYDLVINTVPGRVLGAGYLADLKPGCLVVDLASKPGGVAGGGVTDGMRVIWALSRLPRYSGPGLTGHDLSHFCHESRCIDYGRHVRVGFAWACFCGSFCTYDKAMRRWSRYGPATGT
jgi:hypothetical protein